MYSFARAAVTKYHKLDGLKTKMYCLAVPEAGNPRSICQQGWFLPRGRISPTSPLPASGGLLETSAILWLPEASPPSLPSSSQGVPWRACLSVSRFPLFQCDFVLTDCTCSHTVSKLDHILWY